MAKSEQDELKQRYPELREWMRRTGTRQSDLARLMDVSEATVSRYLSGKQDISPEPAIRLALLSNVPVEKLLTDGRAARLLKLLGRQSNATSPKRRKNDKVA